MTEAADRESWERVRLLAAITVSPLTNKTVMLKNFCRYHGDPAIGNKENKPVLSAKESERRFNDALRRLGESQELSSSSSSGS